MIRIIIIFLNILIGFSLINPALADVSNGEAYTVTVPTYVEVNDIGVVEESQKFGLPKTTASQEDLTYGRLVKGSYTGNYWELTTNKPIGISVKHNRNAKFSISAEPTPLTGGGFTLPDTRIYPTKIIFSRGNRPASDERIFKFYPIVRIYKNSAPGIYSGNITFTITTLD